MKLIQRCLLVLFAATFGVVHAATTIYVDSGVADEGDGTSWETAKKTIQAAIDIAAKNDTILIAKGRYLISSSLKIARSEEEGIHSIELRGATGNPEDVVVDAQGQCPCLVASGWNQIIVNSIAFENGCSTSDPNVAGGITATDKSMITNCIVRSCCHRMSGQNVYGGGINLTTLRSDSNSAATHWPNARQYLPQVVNTLVENCTAYTDGETKGFTARGGGLYLSKHNTFSVTVRNCAVTNFSYQNALEATQGGGAYIDCARHENDEFINNAIVNHPDRSDYLGSGGGVFLKGDSAENSALMTDSLVACNMSHGCGGGIGIGAYTIVDGCSVLSNRLSHVKSTTQYQVGGAGIYVSGSNSRIANSLVSENISTNGANAVTYTGAVNANDVTNTVIRDCVVRDNVLQMAGAFSFISAGGLMVSNCVVFGNVATNEISAIRFRANQKDVANCAMSLIADCYIISNSNPSTKTVLNGGGILNYTGAGAKNSFAAPLTVRNCLFAGNSASNGSRGWGVRATFGTEAGVSLVGDYMLTMDHCTFAKNVSDSNYPNFVDFANAGSPEHVFFKGCAFWENRCNSSGSNPKLAYVSTERVGATFMNCYADVTNAAFTVTAENGNIGGEDAGDVKFADADAFDFRLQPGSCLLDKGGAFEDWMGTGRRKSVHDMGAGYVIGTLGRYGVTVGRKQSNPRRCGKASDIGCCELWWAPGLVMSVK